MATVYATVLINSSVTTNAASYNTSSFNVNATSLFLIAVVNSHASAPTSPSCNGNLATWTKVVTAKFGTTNQLTIFKMRSATAANGTVGFVFAGATQTGCGYVISRFDNVWNPGTADNGSNAIVQIVTGVAATGLAGTLGATLANFSSTGWRNAGFAAFTKYLNNTTNIKSGWTKLGTHGYSTPTTGIAALYDPDGTTDLVPFVGWTSAAAVSGGVALEIKGQDSGYPKNATTFNGESPVVDLHVPLWRRAISWIGADLYSVGQVKTSILATFFRTLLTNLPWSSAGAGGLSTIASDDFNRANTPLNSNGWATVVNVGYNSVYRLAVIDNRVGPEADADDHGAIATTFTYNDDQFSLATYASTAGQRAVGVSLRGSLHGGTSYFAWIYQAGDDSSYGDFFKLSPNYTSSSSPGSASVGDVLKLSARGTNIYAWRNGTVLATVVDSSNPSGQPGLYFWTNAALEGRMDNWIAGNGAGTSTGVTSVSNFSVSWQKIVSYARSLLLSVSKSVQDYSVTRAVAERVRSIVHAISNAFSTQRLGSWKRQNPVVRPTNLSVRRIPWWLRRPSHQRSTSFSLGQGRRLIRRISHQIAENFSVKRIGQYIRRVSISRSIAHSVKRIGQYIRKVSVSRAISSVLSKSSRITRTITHAIIRNSSVRRAIWYVRRVAVSRTLASTAKRIGSFIRRISLVEAIGAVVGQTKTGITQRTVALVRSLSVSVKRIGQYRRNLTRISSLAYRLSRVSATVRSAIRTASLAYQVRRGVFYRRTLALVRPVTSAVRRIGQYVRTVVLSRTIRPIVGRAITIGTYVRTISHTVRVSLSVVRLSLRKRLVSLSVKETFQVSRLTSRIRRLTTNGALKFSVGFKRGLRRTLSISRDLGFSVKRVARYIRKVLLVRPASFIAKQIRNIGEAIARFTGKFQQKYLFTSTFETNKASTKFRALQTFTSSFRILNKVGSTSIKVLQSFKSGFKK
jgi:hypothetical protein